MSRWPVVAFGEILTPNRRPYLLGDDEDANLVGMRLYGRGPFHRELKPAGQIRKKSHFVIRQGDVIYNKLFAWKGTFGIVPPELDGMFVSDKFPTYALDDTRVDPSYLRWYFGYPEIWERARRLSAGSAALSKLTLNPPRFLDLTMPLPPIEEQRRVVRKLNRLAVGEQLVSRLQARARDGSHRLAMSAVLTRLRTWVVDGVPMEPLGALVDVRAGVTLGRKLSGPTVTLPYLRVANVQAGHLDFGVVKEVSILPEEESRWALERGDLLLTEGGDWDKLGRGAVWQGEIQRCIHQNHIYRLRITDDRFDVRYIFLLTQSQYGRDYFSAASKQTTNLASINQRQLKAFPVPAVSMANQLRLVTQWQTLSHLAARATARQDQAQQAAEVLLASAMHSEFDGEFQ